MIPRPFLLPLLLLPMLALAQPAPPGAGEPPPIPDLPSGPSLQPEPSLQPPSEPVQPVPPGQRDTRLDDSTAEKPFQPLPQARQVKPLAPRKVAGAVKVTFLGGRAFPEEEMRGAIADTLQQIEAQGLGNALADDAAFFLANYYREHGYSQVDVAWETPGNNRLVLKISEGVLSRIGRARITGNRQIPEAALLEYLLGPTHERFPKDQVNPPFIEADIETGVGWLQAYYSSQGFLNAVVEPPRYDYSRGRSAVDVEVRVNEGIKYLLGEISFSGEPIFGREELMEQLEKARSKTAKETVKERVSWVKALFDRKAREARATSRVIQSGPIPYTPQEVGRLQQVLEYHYKTKGYFNASVESSSDPALAVNGRVAVNFVIRPGEQYRFDGMTVAGLIKVKPDFLPKRFKRLPGELYNPEKVQEKVREMTRTGLFTRFRVHEEPLPDRTVRLDVTVEEAKAKELGFLLGYSTLEGGLVGASYRDRNLFGEGRPLTASAQYSTRGLRGEIQYSDPWFANDTLILRLRLYALTRKYDGYSKLEQGFRAELARQIKLPGKSEEAWEVSAFLQARHVDLQDVLIQPDVNQELARYHGRERARRREQAREDLIGPTSYLIDSIGLSSNFDTRDSKINPTRGFFFNTTLDTASPVLGSQISFLRATAATSYYMSVGKKGLLAFGARAGIINPFEDRGSIPIDERFFNGGSLSVRSFTERHLGPKDKNGFPVGGDSFTVFNLEYNHPIRGELGGAAFLDAGSLSSGNGFGQMRYGIGVGLRYRLPIGPLRLDYAFNPTRKPDESLGALHFSFGFAF